MISCSVTKSCPALCYPMDCTMPNCPVLYYLSDLVKMVSYIVKKVIYPKFWTCISVKFLQMVVGGTRVLFSSVQFISVAQSCPTLCDPMNCSTPGLPVHHQLLESTQTHVHRVDDAIQPSHPLSSPSPPAFNLSQHQGLFK